MNGYELASGLVDAAVYVVPVLVGAVLWLVGRRRRPRRGASFLMGLGVVLVIVFGLASIGPISRAVASASGSSSAQDASPSTPLAPVATSTSTHPTTTSTARASLYGKPDQATLQAWAAEAIDYAEGQDWRFDDRDGAVVRIGTWAEVICASLARNEGWGSGIDEAYLAQLEALTREGYSMEQWQGYGAVWFDSIVNGLCIAGPRGFGS